MVHWVSWAIHFAARTGNCKSLVHKPLEGVLLHKLTGGLCWIGWVEFAGHTQVSLLFDDMVVKPAMYNAMFHMTSRLFLFYTLLHNSWASHTIVWPVVDFQLFPEVWQYLRYVYVVTLVFDSSVWVTRYLLWFRYTYWGDPTINCGLGHLVRQCIQM